ncbi:MAG: phosphoribosylformylglycinamidine synthase I [Actinobacteria bacterium RBG_19FT_COMBO_54_7]|uniref:Phosphoribosylformylglycinamidine synthase subunit PurQ n=1 Tax=Candidatus Solincola sediminis TaxID=1797199 RepID=A0A1F2WK86_9ACTN|nr:MAG: phosphoribosylformylglycinamidine synthase I [Candidatus Solincola sediminis]OFW70309.1 MAG: phosphoribosylformylglycinamidine synthase I [Actinobacteria bacterium RBG_19FT_COMBO_54_7]
MKFGVVVFPGSNCEADCHHVIGEVLEEDVQYIWHQETDVSSYDCLILPGGFSYGDYLRCGAIARFSPVMETIANYAREGGLVIGICNGFQILLEAGLLPGATLKNTSLRFICRFVNLRVENDSTPWSNQGQAGQVLRIPIAHNEGNYIVGKDIYNRMVDEGRIILRYCDKLGEVTPDANPNGAMDNIAGVCNEGFNVFGLMPHPERASEEILGSTDGLVIWESIMAHYRGKG